jgi:DNA-binding transcriptional LysR family regulator
MKQNFTVRHGALDGVEAFLSVAQHRSFRKAAARLGVTPSAISQAVRALEARVGAALFIRTTRSVGLTEAGERFHSRAKPAFEAFEFKEEFDRSRKSPLSATINIDRSTFLESTGNAAPPT